MSDDDQTIPLSRDDGPSDRIPTRPVPPAPADGPGEPARVPARPPIIQRTWVRVTGAVAGGILLVGAGMGIGWGLAGHDRGWDLAAQSGPGTHDIGRGAPGDMPAPDGHGFGPGGPGHGEPGAGHSDRDQDADIDQEPNEDMDEDADAPLPSPPTTPAG